MLPANPAGCSWPDENTTHVAHCDHQLLRFLMDKSQGSVRVSDDQAWMADQYINPQIVEILAPTTSAVCSDFKQHKFFACACAIDQYEYFSIVLVLKKTRFLLSVPHLTLSAICNRALQFSAICINQYNIFVSQYHQLQPMFTDSMRIHYESLSFARQPSVCSKDCAQQLQVLYEHCLLQVI